MKKQKLLKKHTTEYTDIFNKLKIEQLSFSIKLVYTKRLKLNKGKL